MVEAKDEVQEAVEDGKVVEGWKNGLRDKEPRRILANRWILGIMAKNFYGIARRNCRHAQLRERCRNIKKRGERKRAARLMLSREKAVTKVAMADVNRTPLTRLTENRLFLVDNAISLWKSLAGFFLLFFFNRLVSRINFIQRGLPFNGC